MQNCREYVKYAKYTNGIKITKHQQNIIDTKMMFC